MFPTEGFPQEAEDYSTFAATDFLQAQPHVENFLTHDTLSRSG